MTENQRHTEIRLNTVRKMLYRLYDHSIVSLRRTRDKQTGWFVFHWKLQPDQLEGYIQNQKKRILNTLESRFRYEKENDFYYCNTPSCKRIPFDIAMENIFRCPVCKKQLSHFDNKEIVEALKKKIEVLRTELSEG